MTETNEDRTETNEDREHKQALAADRAYLQGLTTGWNLGVAGDTYRLDAIKTARVEQIEQARRTTGC